MQGPPLSILSCITRPYGARLPKRIKVQPQNPFSGWDHDPHGYSGDTPAQPYGSYGTHPIGGPHWGGGYGTALYGSFTESDFILWYGTERIATVGTQSWSACRACLTICFGTSQRTAHMANHKCDGFIYRAQARLRLGDPMSCAVCNKSVPKHQLRHAVPLCVGNCTLRWRYRERDKDARENFCIALSLEDYPLEDMAFEGL